MHRGQLKKSLKNPPPGRKAPVLAPVLPGWALLVLSLLLLLPACGKKPPIRGEPGNPDISFPYYRVLEVLDGKSILLEPPGGPAEKVRLLGIEYPAPDAEKRARQYLEKTLIAKRVRLEEDKTDRDEEGRLPRYLYLADFTFVNAGMVREGLARASFQEPDTKYRELFKRLEAEAKEKRRGIWKR